MGLRIIVLFWITIIWMLIALLLWVILHKSLSDKGKRYWFVSFAVLVILYLVALPLTKVQRSIGRIVKA